MSSMLQSDWACVLNGFNKQTVKVKPFECTRFFIRNLTKHLFIKFVNFLAKQIQMFLKCFLMTFLIKKYNYNL